MRSKANELLSLLDTHGAALHALLTRLTLRPDVAEDLLQELFLKLKDSEGLEKASNPKAYLFRAAIHMAFDWRRERHMPECLQAEPAGPARSPLDRMIEQEQMEQVLDAMRHLSDLGRQVVVLHYLQHNDYKEIAEQLGKTEHQVRGLCHKALGQLQGLLRATVQGPDAKV